MVGGPGVVISRAISRVTIFITHIRGPITLLITTPEPPSGWYKEVNSGVVTDYLAGGLSGSGVKILDLGALIIPNTILGGSFV